jgi:hypothetical protein
MPLLVPGTAIVPVTPLGWVLTGVDRLGAKPFVPTGPLGSVPREEVIPTGGIAAPTWANAGPQHNSIVATINNGFIGNTAFEHREYASDAPQGTAVGGAAGAIEFIFMFMAVGK